MYSCLSGKRIRFILVGMSIALCVEYHFKLFNINIVNIRRKVSEKYSNSMFSSGSLYGIG